VLVFYVCSLGLFALSGGLVNCFRGEGLVKRGYVVGLVFVAFLSVISLMLNALMVYELSQARDAAMSVVSDARAVLDEVVGDTLSYTLELDQEVPITASVPISQEISVPIQTTVPISIVVSVPVDAGLLGTFAVDVPVHTVVPVDLDVTVPVSETISIVTTVSLDASVPIEIPIRDTQLGAYLEEISAALENAQLRLGKFLVW